VHRWFWTTKEEQSRRDQWEDTLTASSSAGG